MALFYVKQGKEQYDYTLTSIAQKTFVEDLTFTSIKTTNDFFVYLSTLIPEVYQFAPLSKGGSVPYYVPFGPVRIIKYTNKRCNEKLEDLQREEYQYTGDNPKFHDKAVARQLKKIKRKQEREARRNK